LLDQRTFQEIYAYRLKNIVANAEIVHAKLVIEGAYWERFKALLRRMNIVFTSVLL